MDSSIEFSETGSVKLYSSRMFAVVHEMVQRVLWVCNWDGGDVKTFTYEDFTVIELVNDYLLLMEATTTVDRSRFIVVLLDLRSQDRRLTVLYRSRYRIGGRQFLGDRGLALVYTNKILVVNGQSEVIQLTGAPLNMSGLVAFRPDLEELALQTRNGWELYKLTEENRLVRMPEVTNMLLDAQVQSQLPRSSFLSFFWRLMEGDWIVTPRCGVEVPESNFIALSFESNETFAAVAEFSPGSGRLRFRRWFLPPPFWYPRLVLRRVPDESELEPLPDRDQERDFDDDVVRAPRTPRGGVNRLFVSDEEEEEE